MSLTLDLKPGTPKHDNLVKKIFDRVDFAFSELSSFYEGCRQGEEQFYAYIEPPDDEGENPRGDKNRPEYKTIYIPYAYAMAMTQHTYLTSVFLSRSPIFQLQGQNAESAAREPVVESYLNYQVTGGEMRPVLFNWLLDPGRFGAGIIGCYWKNEISYISTLVEVEDAANFATGKKKVLVEQPFTTYQGNELYNVRPLDWFFDPRYSLVDFQKGEFCGEFTTVADHILSTGVKNGTYIQASVDELRKCAVDEYGRYHRQDGSPMVGREITNNNYKFFDRYKDGKKRTKWAHEVVEFHWTIIPSEHELGKSDKPTKYYFCVSTAGIILACGPQGDMHNRYPYAQLSHDVDVYKQTSRSGISVIQPIETILNWLINQHFYNVRKNLNNNSVIDPSMLVLKDLYNRAPGGYIRLAPAAYGKEPKNFIYPLPNTDITRAHLQDVRMMEEFAQRIMGVNDNIMGLVNPGGRKTAQEVRTSSSFATNRLKTQAEWYSATGFASLSRQLVQNSQQYLSGELKLKVSGDLNGAGPQELMVTPDSIAGFYSFEMVDGSMPIDRMSTATILKEMMLGGMQNPMTQQSYDWASLFGYIAILSGAKSIERFKIKVTPPQQIQQGIQSGNMVPIPSGVPGSNSPTAVQGIGAPV